MTTAFLSIKNALIAALKAAPALAAGRISGNKQTPIAANVQTEIVVRTDAADGGDAAIGLTAWQTAYAVECYARAATGQDPADIVDPLLAAAWARLAELTTEAAGADITLNPRIDWQYDTAEAPTVCAVIRVTAQHYTNASDLLPRA